MAELAPHLSLFRGDVSTKDCGSCIEEARNMTTEHCPSSREAIIWYDYCYLKYSDDEFFGKIDIVNKHKMRNSENATRPQDFKDAAIGLLSGLSRIATNTTNKYMFAGGEILFDKEENMTIYGIAECSRDLSLVDCVACLDYAVNELPGFNEKISPEGGRTLTGSCHVGYEIYPFLN